MLYFEDIEVGEERRAGPYLLTADEIMSFATKWDPFDFHMDIEAAKASIYGGLAASGVLTLCIANKLGHELESSAVQAYFGAEYKLPNPAMVDDELTLIRSVLNKRESKSRPDAGIVELEAQLVNQAGSAVLVQTWAVLVQKKGKEDDGV